MAGIVTPPVAERCTAMVLAAGFGTRLEPLTRGRAKAVVPFLNRPLLDYTLDWLRRCGFERVVVNLHHAAGSVVEQYGDRAFGLTLDYSVEDSILGTAGGPRKALARLGERVLIVNGDIVTSLSLGVLWQHHVDGGALATMALHAGEAAAAYPAIDTDDEGRVVKISGVGERPGRRAAGIAAGCFTGVHVVERSVVELAPENRFCGMVDPIYGALLAEDLPLHAVTVPGSWYEVGTIDRYIDCQLEALRREDFPLAFDGCVRETAAAYVARSSLYRRAGLRPPYLLGDGVRIEEGTLVQGLVAGRDAHVGPGATVRDSILLDRAWVGPGARVERSVIMEDAVVGAGATIHGEVVTPEGARRTG